MFLAFKKDRLWYCIAYPFTAVDEFLVNKPDLSSDELIMLYHLGGADRYQGITQEKSNGKNYGKTLLLHESEDLPPDTVVYDFKI